MDIFWIPDPHNKRGGSATLQVTRYSEKSYETAIHINIRKLTPAIRHNSWYVFRILIMNPHEGADQGGEKQKQNRFLQLEEQK